MNSMQYQILMSTKNISVVGWEGSINGYTIRFSNDRAIIEGKIMVSTLDKILKQLHQNLEFVRYYKNIDVKCLTSDYLESVKEEWRKAYNCTVYEHKIATEWEALVNKTPREQLWLSCGVLHCYDAESFSVTLDVLRNVVANN